MPTLLDGSITGLDAAFSLTGFSLDTGGIGR
jgi:hypothetical protein